MKNLNKNRGFAGIAALLIGAILASSIGMYKVQEAKFDEAQRAAEAAYNDARAALAEAQANTPTFGAFRPSNYVGKLLTRLTEGGSETTFNTTPGTAADGSTLTTAKIGDFVVFTINPGASNEEKISASAVSVSGTTATWTIINRGLSFTENVSVTANKKQHAIGETVIISNDDHYLDVQFPAIDEDVTITGNWLVSTPLSNTQIANKAYVDSIVSGGAVSFEKVVVAGTAGETITQGQIVYFDYTEDEWMRADADATSTSRMFLGIAQGGGTNGAAITNGVLIRGLDSTNTGGTAGNIVYLSSTLGATTTTATSPYPRPLGIIRNSAGFYFDPGIWSPHISPTGGSIDGYYLASSTIPHVGGTLDTFSPVGSLTAFASTTAPNGWLLANGQAVSRTTYAQLFAVIGTSYGVGDGATTFNVPDIRGRAIVMASSTQSALLGLNRATLGSVGTTTSHTMTVDEMPAHTHSLTGGDSSEALAGNNVQDTTSTDGVGPTGSAGGGSAFNILDPYIILNYIIKY